MMELVHVSFHVVSGIYDTAEAPVLAALVAVPELKRIAEIVEVGAADGNIVGSGSNARSPGGRAPLVASGSR